LPGQRGRVLDWEDGQRVDNTLVIHEGRD
jgi:hypothetical protein